MDVGQEKEKEKRTGRTKGTKVKEELVSVRWCLAYFLIFTYIMQSLLVLLMKRG
jgi:hypothetical protein